MPNTGPNGTVHVVAGVVRDPQSPTRFLITKRKKGQHLENLWEFPGGKVEAGEARFHALRRELAEEIGIRVISGLPLHSLVHRYPDKQVLLDVWEITEYQGVAHCMEGQTMQWISVEEAIDFSFPDADLPVLNALRLPGELLITPEMSEQHESSYSEQFAKLMARHPYPLVLFRSHNLSDTAYARAANRLDEIASAAGSQVIIHRPNLKSLLGKRFNRFKRRHVTASLLQSLSENPFDTSIEVSASCHNTLDLIKAQQMNCHFALLSMVRESASHPGRQAKGWHQIKNILSRVRLPVFVLGGVRRKDFCVARFQGATGVAGISDFWIR